MGLEQLVRNVGGRKFVAFLLGLAMAFILCLMGRIDGSTFVAAFATGLGIFTVGNVAAGKGGGASG